MARGDQLGRQWQIIQTLISSRRGKSAAELAETLDCNPRTVYRDLEALQIGGFPIYTERVEGKSVWSVLDTVKHHIPIPFNFTELMALYFSREMLEVFKDTVFYDSLESLFQKIKTTLPPESINYLMQLRQTLFLGHPHYKGYGKFKEIINRVHEAAKKKKTLEIVYFAMGRKQETRRRVDPYAVWFFNGAFYLIGHCHLRDDTRIFALDRIKMLHQLKDCFEIPDGFSLREYLRPSFGVFQGEPVHVRIWFDAEVAGYIKEKVWHESQKITPMDDNSVILDVDVAGTDDIKFWIMNWGAKALVLEPDSLRDEILQEAREMSKNYGIPLENMMRRLKM